MTEKKDWKTESKYWKKEYFKMHKLLGRDETLLTIQGIYWNEKANKMFVVVSKGNHGMLGHISISTKIFLGTLAESEGCTSWESNLKELRGRE